MASRGTIPGAIWILRHSLQLRVEEDEGTDPVLRSMRRVGAQCCPLLSSPRRKPGSRSQVSCGIGEAWIPAFAGMTPPAVCPSPRAGEGSSPGINRSRPEFEVHLNAMRGFWLGIHPTLLRTTARFLWQQVYGSLQRYSWAGTPLTAGYYPVLG
jgi:hypothetical protein